MKKTRENGFARVSSFFYKNWRFTMLFWATLLIGGATTYTSLIKREGFPPVQFPLTVVSGTYFVDDAAVVDEKIARPVSQALENVEELERLTVTSGSNFFSIVAQFKSDTLPETGTSLLKTAIDGVGLPKEAQLDFTTIDPASFLNRYDMLVSVYSIDSQTKAADLQQVADGVAKELMNDERIVAAETVDLVSEAINPTTGVIEERQTAFSRIGLPESGELSFYPAITIGIDRDAQAIDIIGLSNLMREKLANLDLSTYGDGYRLAVGADFAESITTQISSLESNLLGGLIAVAIISLLLITWRASVITALFMVTVMATVIILLYAIGYTLNTITLFALVLSLGLFVDDATIVVEALDANRKQKKKTSEIIVDSVRKVGAASFAGTMTTVLVFLPLTFISGVLGEFIRLMPITIILSLLTSLILSLTVIPVLSKFILLKKYTSAKSPKMKNPVALAESMLAQRVSSLTALLKSRRRLGLAVGTALVALSILFVLSAGMFAQKLTFNVFPASKDSDQIGFQVSFPPSYNLAQAEAAVDQINEITARTLGSQTVRVTYGSFNQPNERGADALIELVSFTDRESTSPELMEKLQVDVEEALDDTIGFRVVQYDAGPPAEEYPFKVQIYEEDVAKAQPLIDELASYLDGATVTRANGTTARIVKVSKPSPVTIERRDGDRVFEVAAAFDAIDTSALVLAAEEKVTEEFSEDALRERGFSADTLRFDFGQESENEESFSSLGVIFPIAVLLMYLLLAMQFRSLLQPLLIFLAIPFSLFGVFAGLYMTDNSLSFFSMIGLIGLIGIAVNNTIMLTDYANQERRKGKSAVDAISEASRQRFRPLVTTTLTTVVALLPLALSDPFWEALAFTIIFGLLSSTFLVILSFPYYYLMSESIRGASARAIKRIRRKH